VLYKYGNKNDNWNIQRSIKQKENIIKKGKEHIGIEMDSQLIYFVGGFYSAEMLTLIEEDVTMLSI